MTFAPCSPERSPERTANALRTFAGSSPVRSLNVRRVFGFPVPSRPVPVPTHTRPVPSHPAFSQYLTGNDFHSLVRSGRASAGNQ